MNDVYAQLNVEVSSTTTFQNTTGQNVKATINNNTGDATIKMGSFSISVSTMPPVVLAKRIYKLVNTSQSVATLPDGMDFSFGDLVE